MHFNEIRGALAVNYDGEKIDLGFRVDILDGKYRGHRSQGSGCNYSGSSCST
jgi:hypothetical protein